MMDADRRKAFLAERRTGLGGSDAAGACSQSKWKTPYDIYSDKLGLSDDVETDAMRRGTLLEPVVRQMYADQYGVQVATPPNMFLSNEFPWALAHLDGVVVGNPIGVECKTARDRREWGDPGTDDVPPDYLFQVQHYMAVTKLPVFHIAVLFGTDFEFAVYEVESDPEFQGLMMECERELWDRILRREPPDPENASDVAKRWPISRPVSIAATSETLDIIGSIAAIKEKIKQLEQVCELHEAEIKSLMQDAEALTFGDEVVCTWKTASGAKRFDKDRFAKEHADLYAKYLVQSASSRRFLLKGTKACVEIAKVTSAVTGKLSQ